MNQAASQTIFEEHMDDEGLKNRPHYYMFNLLFGEMADSVAIFILIMGLMPKEQASLLGCINRFMELYRIFKLIVVDTKFRVSTLCLY